MRKAVEEGKERLLVDEGKRRGASCGRRGLGLVRVGERETDLGESFDGSSQFAPVYKVGGVGGEGGMDSGGGAWGRSRRLARSRLQGIEISFGGGLRQAGGALWGDYLGPLRRSELGLKRRQRRSDCVNRKCAEGCFP